MTTIVVILIFGFVINLFLVSLASHIWGKFRVVLAKAWAREEAAKEPE